MNQRRTAALVLLLIALMTWPLAPRAAAQRRPAQAKSAVSSHKPVTDASKDATRLGDLITRLMSEGDVTGLSLTWIRNGKVYLARGFGVKEAGTKEAVDTSTMFEAASLSKPVFAYAVLRMVERGELDLDTPLSKYLPGYIESDERLNQITARRVLSHTSGFPNWRPDGKSLLIMFQPGERFSYSGEGFVYLQKVVERLTGQPLNEVIRKEVFAPLGMNDSTYVWQDRVAPQMAAGHSQAGKPLPMRKGAEANAAASLRTTPSDYAKFVIAVMNGAGLKAETGRQMLTPQIRLDEGCVICLGRKVVK